MVSNHIKLIKRDDVPPPKKQTNWWSDMDEDNDTGEQNMVAVKNVESRTNKMMGLVQCAAEAPVRSHKMSMMFEILWAP